MYRRISAGLATAVSRLLHDESGQDVVEYSLLLTLVSLGVIAAVDHAGDAVYYTFLRIAKAVVTQRVDFN